MNRPQVLLVAVGGYGAKYLTEMTLKDTGIWPFFASGWTFQPRESGSPFPSVTVFVSGL